METQGTPRGHADWALAALALMLLGVGLIMVYSASFVLALKNFGDAYYFIKRQMVWALLGGAGMWWVSRQPYSRLRAWVFPGLMLAGGLLAAVSLLSLGHSAGGARRWLVVGPLSFQPAELLKVVLVVYLADALARKQGKLQSFQEGVLSVLLVVAGMGGLLLLQPDLGTTVILAVVACAMLFAAGARPAHLLGLGLAALPAALMLVFRVGYRRRRLDVFFDPWQDPLGKGFQIIQSYLALGSGGLWGRGLCESQQKFFYLPAPHTDFIFSILGEELGFVGTLGILVLFGLVVARGFAIARACPETFGKLLALGLTLLLGLQAFVNMGVTAGLVPTKGTTLPLVSAGGSSLFCTLVAMGILLSVSRSAPAEAA